MLVVGMSLVIPDLVEVAIVLDEMGEDEKAWVPSAASIRARTARDTHDESFCLDGMIAIE